jgi:hypothetical protein
MQKIFLLLGITALSLSACKKNSEPVPAPDVRTSLLLAHDWKLAAQTLTFNHDGKAEIIDGYASTIECARDNTTRFNTDKSLTYAEGAVSCAPNLQPQTGSWFFNQNQTELSINSPQLHGATSVFQVLDLTEKTLQIRHTYTYRQDNHDYTGVEDYTYTAL